MLPKRSLLSGVRDHRRLVQVWPSRRHPGYLPWLLVDQANARNHRRAAQAGTATPEKANVKMTDVQYSESLEACFREVVEAECQTIVPINDALT